MDEKEIHKPALLLLPNLLDDTAHPQLFFPTSVNRTVATLDGLIAESERGGRRYLGRFETKKPAAEIPIALFNEQTPDDQIDFLLEPIQRKGERWGFVSDAGLPCIADPGAKLVRRANSLGLKVQAFVGPSSILMALMLSGLSGQNFTFHGYLSKDKETLREELAMIEKSAKSSGYTQLFMETPYRNQSLFEEALKTLNDNTLFSVAWDLTLPTQRVLTYSIGVWKKNPPPNLDKRNAIFLIS